MTIGLFLDLDMPVSIGGGYTYPQSLARALARAGGVVDGHRVVVLHDGGCLDGAEAPMGFYDIVDYRQPRFFERVFNRIKRPFGKADPIARDTRSEALNRTLRKAKVDVLIVTCSVRFHDIICPYVYVVWDLGHRTIPQFSEVTANGQYEIREDLQRQMIGHAALVVSGNEQGVREVREHFGVSQERVTALDFFTPEFVLSLNGVIPRDPVLREFALGKKFVFYPAQFWAHKNHAVIVDAMSECCKEGIDVGVVFCGSDRGCMDQVKRQADDAGLGERVVFPGFLPVDEVVWLYEHAVALVYASYLGPNNLPPYEAMALGCPVIVSDIPGHREQCAGKALFFDPGDAVELADKIKSVLAGDEAVASAVAAGKAFARVNSAEKYLVSLCSIAARIFRRSDSPRKQSLDGFKRNSKSSTVFDA
jgi:glycosyltransferase involved in cell wall biosynthesis